MMDFRLAAIVIGILIVTIGGILARKPWLRVLLWVLSLPALALGLLALSQGGIAEKFQPDFLIVFCVTALAPAVGCATGEVIRMFMRKGER